MEPLPEEAEEWQKPQLILLDGASFSGGQGRGMANLNSLLYFSAKCYS
ncbi:MAG: hypothetical protein ACPK85_16020 [Methanosarcina sp.]